MIMLDTNAASALVRNDAAVVALVGNGTRERIVFSAVTAGELLFGVERKPSAQNMRTRIRTLLSAIESLPWSFETASVYARVKADCIGRGKTIGHLDMLIAAHAVSVGARLATRDKSFARLELVELSLVDF